MRKPLTITLTICLLAALASPADAGVVRGSGWNEGGDAGRTTALAQVTVGVGGLASITGMTGGTPLVGPTTDFEDVFMIFIIDPSSFSMSTVGSVLFDTELFLFDAGGFGLLANDDAAAGVLQSTIPNAADDGTGAMVSAAGIYFLAITGKGNKPTSNDGVMQQLIFNQASPTEVSGPDGLGGMFVQNDWAPGAGPVGEYTIALEGVQFAEQIPEPSTFALAALSVLGMGCFGRRRRRRSCLGGPANRPSCSD